MEYVNRERLVIVAHKIVSVMKWRSFLLVMERWMAFIAHPVTAAISTLLAAMDSSSPPSILLQEQSVMMALKLQPLILCVLV